MKNNDGSDDTSIVVSRSCVYNINIYVYYILVYIYIYYIDISVYVKSLYNAGKVSQRIYIYL